MGTLYVALTRGPYQLVLTTGRYRIADDFVPPAIAAQPLFAAGTSANRNGASLVSVRPLNREWAFGLHIEAASAAEMSRAVADVQAFLNFAGNENEPVYLDFRPVGEVPEPLWGSCGANYRFEVVYGVVALSEAYGSPYLRDVALPNCRLSLSVKPYAVGRRQRLASALGRIGEDNLGTPDGSSRGLHLGPALTNKMTCPMFGANAFTNWTADASLTASANTDPRYLLRYQPRSAKLVSRSTNQEYYQSINVGNTNTHTFVAVVALPDLGTPSSSDVVLFYNATLSTTFTELGNGLWLLTATAAGINASTNTGVQVLNGRTIYLLYYGCFETSDGWVYPFWGDSLGAAWSGTAHASTSTSTAGRVRLPIYDDTFNIAEWTIRMVVRWKVPNTYGSDMQLFSLGASNIRARFNATGDTISLTDNTNTATTAALTFAAEDETVLHFSAVPGTGLVVYVNGASAGTVATYTPPTLGSYLYVATDDSAATHLRGLVMDLAVFDQGLSAAQVLADYTNVTQLAADGQRLGGVPWYWTKDGDDVVDNSNDSGRNNFAVVGGVPGSEPALYVMTFTSSLDDTTSDVYYLNSFATPQYVPIDTALFLEVGGSASVGQSNADVSTVSVSTAVSDTLSSRPNTANTWLYRMISNHAYKARAILCRLSDAGSNLTMAMRTVSGGSVDTDYASLASSASFLVFATPEMGFAPGQSDKVVAMVSRPIFRRTTGTANISVDYIQLAIGRLLKFSTYSGSSGGAKIGFDNVLGLVYACDSAATLPLERTDAYVAAGDLPELEPHAYNHLAFVRFGAVGATLTAQRLFVWPRYAIF